MLRRASVRDQLSYAMRFHIRAFAARDDLAAAHHPVAVDKLASEGVILLEFMGGVFPCS